MSIDSIGASGEAVPNLASPLKPIGVNSNKDLTPLTDAQPLSSKEATAVSFTLDSLSNSITLASTLVDRTDANSAKRLIGLAKGEVSALIDQLTRRLESFSPDALSQLQNVEVSMNRTLERMSFGYEFEDFPKKVDLIKNDLANIREIIENKFNTQLRPQGIVETVSDAARKLAGSRVTTEKENEPPYATDILNSMVRDPESVLKAQGSVDSKRILEIVGDNRFIADARESNNLLGEDSSAKKPM